MYPALSLKVSESVSEDHSRGNFEKIKFALVPKFIELQYALEALPVSSMRYSQHGQRDHTIGRRAVRVRVPRPGVAA